MTENIFKEIYQKKQNLISILHKTAEFGWIDSKKEQEIINKINSDILTIGIIGQMKSGKSTFLNAWVFEDDILPVSTTPMTSSLTIITYGTEKKINIEFYTKNEWEEQKILASRNLESVKGNYNEENKIKAAQELINNSKKLSSDIDKLLDTTKTDNIENLIEYVGADGKYTAVTKCVTIYYPREYLKGVEIVDTPGFNDPVVSREERTKQFISKADVVLLMLYAGRAYDSTDRDIIFKTVSQAGIGKVLIGINKYDVSYGSVQNPESPEEIEQTIVDEIKKSCKECKDERIVDMLKNIKPIAISSEMSLLSKINFEQISNNKSKYEVWKRYSDIFEINNQKQMQEKSRMDNLILAVKNVIEKEKEVILINKPLNSIRALIDKKKFNLNNELEQVKMLIKNLQIPDDELEEKKRKLDKAKSRLNNKIDSLGEDIEYEFKEIIRKANNNLEDCVDKTCDKMRLLVDNFNWLNIVSDSADKLIANLENEQQKLLKRTLKREIEYVVIEVKTKLTNMVRDFFNDVDEIIIKYFPDLEDKEIVKNIKHKIELSVDKELFETNSESNDNDNPNVIIETGKIAVDTALAIWFPYFYAGKKIGEVGFKFVGNLVDRKKLKIQLYENINSLSSEFDATAFSDAIMNKKTETIDITKKELIDGLVVKIEEQINSILENKLSKEEQLTNAKEKEIKLMKDKSILEEQIKSIENNLSI